MMKGTFRKSVNFSHWLIVPVTMMMVALGIWFPGCKKSVAPEEPAAATSMEELVIQPGFTWESSRVITVRVSVDLLPVNIGSLSTVAVYDSLPTASPHTLIMGSVGYDEPFESELRIPTSLKKLYFQLHDGNGAIKTDSAEVQDLITVQFSEASFLFTKETATDPNCSGATSQNTLTGNQVYTISNGTNYYVTGDFSGTVHFAGNGGTITVCGNMHPQSVTDMGNFCYIVVAQGGTFHYAGTLAMNSGSRLYSYPNSHVYLEGVTMSSSRIWNNCTDFTVNGNLVPSGGFENYGAMTINSNLTFGNSITTLVNSGSIKVGNDFHLASTFYNNGGVEVMHHFYIENGTFYNNCKLTVHEDAELSNGTLSMNGAYFREYGNLKINSGFTLLLKNNSMISTLNYEQSVNVSGSGGASELKITGSGQIHSSYKVSGPIEVTTPTGTLASGGSSNLINGAVLRSIQNAMVNLPVSSCNPEGMGQGAPPTDADMDGIPDNLDQYPADPARAFNNFYPSSSTFATLAFEDCWPARGDYDLNDLVVDYRFQTVTNAQNKVVDIRQKFYVRAAGASYKNGFGIQYDGLLPGQVASVSGCSSGNTIISTASNGVENNQSKAVVVIFDNFRNVVHLPPGYPGMYNTQESNPKGFGDTLNVIVHLGTPVALSTLGSPPYNPFLIKNMNRSVEVHLADYPPTSLADQALFGTESDNSVPATGRYYKTSGSLPWALNLPVKYDYTQEKTAVISGYAHFSNWAQSSGAAYPDWYSNNPGFRQTDKIYH